MRRRVAVLWVVFMVVPLVGFASPGGAGSSITAARQALASVPPHVVALARALAAHPLAAALPAGFRNVGCGLRDHAIPCPVHISPKPDNVVVIYYMLLKRKPGPQNVYLNYRIYATLVPSLGQLLNKGATCGASSANPSGTRGQQRR